MIRRCAVLGSPIAHSLSPVLHRAAYAALGLDWSYDAIECGADDLAELLGGLGPEWRGLSLTMPLKEAALGQVDQVDPVAADCRAINTILFEPTGSIGTNTDVAGFVGAWQSEEVMVPSAAAILGAGATARSAAAALAAAGAREVTVVARRQEAADAVFAAAPGLTGSFLPWAQAESATEQLVISTVPSSVDIPVPAATVGRVFFDVAYHPWPTAAAGRWAAGGGRAIGGLSLLLHQAYAQVELMTGLPAPRQAMRDAGMAALQQR